MRALTFSADKNPDNRRSVSMNVDLASKRVIVEEIKQQLLKGIITGKGKEPDTTVIT